MSCDHELANERARCSGKNASYITISTVLVYTNIVYSQCIMGRPSSPPWNCQFVASCQRDKVTVEHYLYPIRHSRSSLNRKLERLTRSTSQGKRLVKTVMTNVVVEHVKSRMSNSKSPWFITSLNMLMCKCYDGNFTDLIHESLSYLPNSSDS